MVETLNTDVGACSLRLELKFKVSNQQRFRVRYKVPSGNGGLNDGATSA